MTGLHDQTLLMPRFHDRVELCTRRFNAGNAVSGEPSAPGLRPRRPRKRGSAPRFPAFPALESYRGAEPENSGISRMDTGAWLQIILKVWL